INHALDLWEKGYVKWVIFTGGLAAKDRMSEAEAARRYALLHGLSSRAILIEDRSTITWENLAETRKLVKTHGIETLLIVSDPMHMRRAMIMAAELGLQARPSPTPTTRYR